MVDEIEHGTRNELLGRTPFYIRLDNVYARRR